ncbi:hypothetical protein J2S69_000434 [Glycomyces lechevalierae]|uniref:Uncharacterized protein n=1 Tax=Glycomyces lechevalierae TaxID=256034 RepID=A0ABU2AI11_9ACTN|nr:hypothetical protein [Glycomyces lechevalierae]
MTSADCSSLTRGGGSGAQAMVISFQLVPMTLLELKAPAPLPW